MLVPLKLVEGPEYAESLKRAREQDKPRFEDHLKAVLAEARLLPAAATPFLDSKRVSESRDEAHGYSVWLYFDIDMRSHTGTLLWIEVSPHSDSAEAS